MSEISNFIKTIMEKDLKENKVTKIVTRFPPEPNAYLHIGHARAIITNFELAKCFKGKCNLRFDDTNPTKEDEEYVDAIIEDIRWLGYEPDKILFGSDYFEETFEKAILLIKKGLAYVCNLTQEEVNLYRGSLDTKGKDSPFRSRPIEENLKLFIEMSKGKFKEGEITLRAKIDMSSPNINLRDPILYRVLYTSHHRHKNKWCIYPMYDFAHPLQDSFEKITHSLCSLEYVDHKVLYDWVINNTNVDHYPTQIEFGRLNINEYAPLMSKRYLKSLVDNKIVDSYDDPRLPTLRGLKNRGYTPKAIYNFVVESGLSRINSQVDISSLHQAIREDIKLVTPRLMGVINPLKLTIRNYPEDKIEEIKFFKNPENEDLGFFNTVFSKHLYIDKEDFIVEAYKGYKRLSLNAEVRLMHAYFVRAVECVYDENNNVIEVLCEYDINTKSGSGFNDRKPQGTISWVSCHDCSEVIFNHFESLVLNNDRNLINKNSLTKYKGFIMGKTYFDCFQIIRKGYYKKVDEKQFNQIVSLKSSF